MTEKLTPQAKIERGKRLQDEGRRLEIEGMLELHAANDFYDQHTVPIAKRRYLADARAKKFKSWKLGERVCVKREDFAAYLEEYGIIREGTEKQDVEEIVEEILKAGGT